MEDQRLHHVMATSGTLAVAKMLKMKALACLAMALSLVGAVTAADYVVGNPAGGWDGRTDYKSWAAAQTFAPGDTLTFKYNSYHSVMEVSKDAYEACTTTDPISYDNSGSTTIALTMPGTHYFICAAPGHCQGGMKMEVEVADRPAPTAPSSPPPLPAPPAHAKKQRHATAPSPGPLPWIPTPRSWSPAPAPAAAPPKRAGHKKHRKRYCPPDTVRAPARPPTVQAVEADFPVAAFAPMSAPPPPPTSGVPGVLRATWGEAAVALAALNWFMLVAL